jgi:hypothetical protein
MPSTALILMLLACISESYVHARCEILTTGTYTITDRAIAKKSRARYPGG